MKSVEKTGKTVDEAIQAALEELGVKREEAKIEVLDEGAKGFLGILGARPARVRVTVDNSLDAKVNAAREFLAGLLERMNVNAEIETEIGEDQLVYIRMSGRRMGVVIGRRGQTLDAIQYLVNLVANKLPGPRARIVLDAEGYRAKRAETLRNLATRLAAKAKSERRKTVLEPMNALERRIVHLALADDAEVETRSEGEEPYRRVVILPKRT
ncbi:MAG TPA: RNA-binding cell elongation regulator Jag/EloR [Limnochordia bacterium]|nr:RNA-binding cell elongation regulator Jag/EloR [Limnochordia bacterium]